MKPNRLAAWVLAAVLLGVWCPGCKSSHSRPGPERIRSPVGEFRMGPYPVVVCIARQKRAIDVDLLVTMPIDNEHPIDPSRLVASLVLKDGSALTNPVMLLPASPPPPFGPPGAVPEPRMISRWYLAKFGSKVKPKQIKAMTIAIDGRPLTFPVRTVR